MTNCLVVNLEEMIINRAEQGKKIQ